MEELTVKQAIEQGYNYFVYKGMGNDQSLNYLTDISDEDYENEPILLEKEPTHPLCPTPNDFREWVVDQLHENWNCDDSYFDREMYEDAMKSVDFTDIVNKMTQELKGLRYFKGIDIRLIKEKQEN